MANINMKTEGLNKVLEVSKEVLVSDTFSESTSYTAGQFCIYNNKLYKFTSNKTAGAWDSTKVTETRVDNEISSINASLANKEDAVKLRFHNSGVPLSIIGSSDSRPIVFIKGSSNTHYYIGIGEMPIVSDGAYDINITFSNNTLTLPTYGYYDYAIIKTT